MAVCEAGIDGETFMTAIVHLEREVQNAVGDHRGTVMKLIGDLL